MRILGLDLGSKRIGLALSDAEAGFAFPAGTLSCAGRKADLAALHSLIEEKGVARVVVGLPRHMDGSMGKAARAAETFARELCELAGVPVDTLDERWTSVEAERALSSQGKRGRAVREHVDEVAAAIILRTYLELREHESSEAEAQIADREQPVEVSEIVATKPRSR